MQKNYSLCLLFLTKMIAPLERFVVRISFNMHDIPSCLYFLIVSKNLLISRDIDVYHFPFLFLRALLYISDLCSKHMFLLESPLLIMLE